MMDVEVRDMFGTLIFEKRVETLDEGKELMKHVAEDHKVYIYDKEELVWAAKVTDGGFERYI